MKSPFLVIMLLLLGHGAEVNAKTGNSTKPTSPPNIIYILADDLGYSDISCYGQKTLKTPHLDRMAAEGMRFTRHYSGSTVCAPSRCVLLTGLHTGHARIRGNGPGQLTEEDLTFARLLRNAGYYTGCFGKWGIGNPPPLNDPFLHGFDEFYGYVNMFHAHNYYPEFLIRNGRKEPLKNRLYADWKTRRKDSREGAGVAEIAIDYAPELIRQEALEFIRKAKDKSFFLFYALNIPHANNEGGGESRIERNGMRVPDISPYKTKDWPLQEKGFARMIDMIDSDVGSILSLLKELGIDESTIVMFSSDNGPHQEGGHKMEFFNSNGPLRGMKRDLYEGGIRVPFIVRWPGRVPMATISHHVSGFQDLFPTLIELAGIPTNHPTDGISMVPTLLGHTDQQLKHDHLYWEFYEQGGKTAVVKDQWKAVQRNILKKPDSPIEIYNLERDIGETKNLATNHPELVSMFRRIMAQEHLDP